MWDFLRRRNNGALGVWFELYCDGEGWWAGLYDRGGMAIYSSLNPPPLDYLEPHPHPGSIWNCLLIGELPHPTQTPETSAHSLSFFCNLCGNFCQDIARMKNHIMNSHCFCMGKLTPTTPDTWLSLLKLILHWCEGTQNGIDNPNNFEWETITQISNLSRASCWQALKGAMPILNSWRSKCSPAPE